MICQLKQIPDIRRPLLITGIAGVAGPRPGGPATSAGELLDPGAGSVLLGAAGIAGLDEMGRNRV